MIGLDTETCLITPEDPTPRIVCLSYHLEGQGSGLVDKHSAVSVAADILATGEPVVGHNITYDMRVLVRAGLDENLVWEAYDNGRIVDTKVKAWLDDIARGVYQGARKGAYTLAACMARYLGEHLEKEDTWRLRYGELIDTPIGEWPEAARTYPLSDAEAPVRLFRAIRTKGDGTTPDLERQCAHMWWLSLMASHGMTVDQERVAALFSQITTDAGEIARQLLPLKWVSFDRKGLHRHPSRVAAYMKKIGKDDRKTKKGAISIDAVACEQSGDENLAAYGKLSRLLDAISKDSKYLGTPVVRCSYGLAESGRTTCWGPNLQNLKKETFEAKGAPRILGIRECLIPRPGHLFAGADYDGLELRTMAQVCLSVLGQSRLADVLNAGRDPHCEVASRILGCTYDEAVARKSDKGEGYRARQTGKVANFGFPGGLGAKRLVEYAAGPAYRVTLTEDQARDLKRTWLDTYPEFDRYFRWINQVVERGEPLEQLFSGRLRGGLGFTDAANTAFQGLGGDASKAAGYALMRACRVGSLRGCMPVVYVHDEFLVEVPEDRAHECAEEMARIMVEAAQVFLPHVPPTAEPYLARRWSKGAHRIVDNQGRLIPWDG